MSDRDLIIITEQLLEVLESDAQYISQVIKALDQLRSLLIKHDLTGLEQMLHDIRVMADTHTVRELAREQLRADLAKFLGCTKDELKITRLAEVLPQPWQNRLLQIRSRLIQLTDQLGREHRATAILLADCARFNRRLLASLLQDNALGSLDYPTSEVKMGRCEGHLVNVKF